MVAFDIPRVVGRDCVAGFMAIVVVVWHKVRGALAAASYEASRLSHSLGSQSNMRKVTVANSCSTFCGLLLPQHIDINC